MVFPMTSGYEKSHDYSGPDPSYVIWTITLGTLFLMGTACWFIW
jgi:hypothetical protein